MAKQGSESARFGASVIMSSDMVYDLYCEVCHEDGRHLEAEGYCTDCQDFLCRDCYKGHRSSRACRNHVLQDKEHMPRQRPAAPGPRSAAGTCTEKCGSHPDRLVEYYCSDDKTFGCGVCVTIKHRKCDKVDHIPDLAEQLLDSQEYKQFTNSLKTLKSKSEGVIKVTKENVTKTEKWFNDAAARLVELRKKMNEAFDKCEGDLKKKASTIKYADIQKMKDIADKGKAVKNEVESISADVQSLQSNNQLGQVFIQMKQLEDRVEAFNTLLTGAEADNSVTPYTFEPGTKIQEILDDAASIGKLTVHASDRSAVQPSTTPATQTAAGHATGTKPATSSAAPIDRDPRNMKAGLIGDVNVKTKRDNKVCGITGSVLLPSNRLILADRQNSKVKLLSLQTSQITSELDTPTFPWDITNITEDQVATTLTGSRTILFVKVTDKLKKDRAMPVDGGCEAIVHNNGKLIVSYVEPVKIEIMTMNGTVERKIQQQKLFESPWHMTLSPGHDTLYVSDWNSGCVKRITLDGTVQAVYKDEDVRQPRGITVDQQGRVLVCGEWSRNIHLLTADLTKVKVLKDGLDCPTSLSYCHSTSRLYVGMYPDHVRVYQLS